MMMAIVTVRTGVVSHHTVLQSRTRTLYLLRAQLFPLQIKCGQEFECSSPQVVIHICLKNVREAAFMRSNGRPKQYLNKDHYSIHSP